MIGEYCEISTNGEFCSSFSSKKYNNDRYLNILVKNFSIAVCDIGRSLSISDALECMFMNTVVGRFFPCPQVVFLIIAAGSPIAVSKTLIYGFSSDN